MRPVVFALALLTLAVPARAQDLYEYQALAPRWASPENPKGTPGQGGQENRCAKGHPFDTLRAGQSLTLADIQGSGVIRRMCSSP